MAGGGYRSWIDGETITFGNVQSYLQDQSVMVFASAAARTTAIGTPTEGMVTYLSDTDTMEVYTGSAWVVYAQQLVYASYTPTISGWSLGDGSIIAKYIQLGKLVHCYWALTLGATSTTTAALTVSTPVAPAMVHYTGMSGQAYDVSVGRIAPLVGRIRTTSGGQFFPMFLANVTQQNNGGLLSPNNPWAWVGGDQVLYSVTYEAA